MHETASRIVRDNDDFCCATGFVLDQEKTLIISLQANVIDILNRINGLQHYSLHIEILNSFVSFYYRSVNADDVALQILRRKPGLELLK